MKYFEENVRLQNCAVFPEVRIGCRSYANDSMIRSGTTIGRYCSIGRRTTINAGKHRQIGFHRIPISLRRR
jgi:UDP-3-O-[3-hydroxymyristoyl] glucosamine N-acyltransferase